MRRDVLRWFLREAPRSPAVVAAGVAAPGPASFGDESAGGLVVVAEGLGDHGRGCLEDKLADGGTAARGGRDAEFVDRAGEGLGSLGLARAATGEQSSAALRRA